MSKPRPAGWFPDPELAGTQRYWNGEAWTDHHAPLPPPPPESSSVSVWKIAAGILVAVVIVWIVYSIAHANDGLNCSLDNADRASHSQPLRDCSQYE